MAKKRMLTGVLGAADKMVAAAERMKRRTDPTLPADSDPEMGAGPLRPSQRRNQGTGATRTGLSAKQRKLRDEFFDLKPSIRREEIVKGSESKFAPYFAAQRRLDRQVREADDFVPNDPSLRRQKPAKPKLKALGKKMNLEDVKAKLLARGDAEGMKDGGLTRKKRKTAEAYKEYMKPSAVKKRKKNVKTAASAKRKRITENIMSAAKGGMAGKKPRNANIDYRKGGMFYVGGTSAKVTPINKGKK
tara:strand:- start:88 stop:825 length:738 start_codon:yes stop_codon:yes gene_type:complete